MKTILLISITTTILATISPAQTCREVVRDSSARIVQTIERQKQAGGNEQAVIRDASGRITGTATTQPSGRTTTTLYRDASGRLSGSAWTNHARTGRAHTIYRDAPGRLTATADTTKLAGAEDAVPGCLGPPDRQRDHWKIDRDDGRLPTRRLRPAHRQQHGQREMPRRDALAGGADDSRETVGRKIVTPGHLGPWIFL